MSALLLETKQSPRQVNTEGLAKSFDGDNHILARDSDPAANQRTEVEQARALLLLALEILTPAIRCRLCGHPLTADKSVRRGIGPVCRRREAVELRVIT